MQPHLRVVVCCSLRNIKKKHTKKILPYSFILRLRFFSCCFIQWVTLVFLILNAVVYFYASLIKQVLNCVHLNWLYGLILLNNFVGIFFGVWISWCFLKISFLILVQLAFFFWKINLAFFCPLKVFKNVLELDTNIIMFQAFPISMWSSYDMQKIKFLQIP